MNRFYLNRLAFILLVLIGLTYFKEYLSDQKSLPNFELVSHFTDKSSNFKSPTIEEPNPKHVFIDLGARHGDTVYDFLGISKHPFGGYYRHKAYPKWPKNTTWIIYAVEANPFLDAKLYHMKRWVESLNHTVHLYNQTAAWTKDGFIDFYMLKEDLTSQASALDKKNVIYSF
jgi:hypothetical protein